MGAQGVLHGRGHSFLELDTRGAQTVVQGQAQGWPRPPRRGHGVNPGWSSEKGTAGMGVAVYERKCQSCHGAQEAGQPNDRLDGGQGALATKEPVRTIGSYWP